MNLNSKTAGQLMITEVFTIDGATTLRAATATMHEKRLRALVVPPAGPGDGYGIITVKDIIGVIHADGGDDLGALDDLTVADTMTRPAICAQEGLGISDCISLMRMTGVRRLPVLRCETIVGILSYSDIFEMIAADA